MNDTDNTEVMIQNTHQPTTFASLPLELHGMILERVLWNIDVDHPADLNRWSYQNSIASTAPSTKPTKILPPCHYRSDPILKPGERLNSKIRVILDLRSSIELQTCARRITVLVPRKWLEVVASRIFHNNDLVFFSRHMDIEVESLMVKTSQYIVSGPDTVIESLLRDLLAHKKDLRVYDYRLYSVNMRPANLSCFLPRLERLNIAHVGHIIWEGQNGGHILPNMNRRNDLHTLHVLTHQEVTRLTETGAFPHGVGLLIRRREFVYELLMMMSLRRITAWLAVSKWAGSARYSVLVLCIAEGSEGLMNSRVVHLRLHLDLDWKKKGGWKIVAADVAEQESALVSFHAWATLAHLNF